MYLGLLIIAISLVLFGCAMFEETTTGIEEKAEEYIEEEQAEEEIEAEPEEIEIEAEEDEEEEEIEEEPETPLEICLDMDDEEKDECLIDLAEKEKDMEVCNEVETETNRESCIKIVAHILHDVDVCDVLDDEDDQLFCRVHSGAQSTGGLT